MGHLGRTIVLRTSRERKREEAKTQWSEGEGQEITILSPDT